MKDILAFTIITSLVLAVTAEIAPGVTYTVEQLLKEQDVCDGIKVEEDPNPWRRQDLVDNPAKAKKEDCYERVTSKTMIHVIQSAREAGIPLGEWMLQHNVEYKRDGKVYLLPAGGGRSLVLPNTARIKPVLDVAEENREVKEFKATKDMTLGEEDFENAISRFRAKMNAD